MNKSQIYNDYVDRLKSTLKKNLLDSNDEQIDFNARLIADIDFAKIRL